MSFTDLLFYPCLAAAALCFYGISGKFRPLYLLVISYAFYAYWNPLYLGLMIVVSAVVYGLGLRLAVARTDTGRNLLLAGGVAALVGLIAAYKVAGISGGILAPLGLSYYSFKLIGYLIEVSWDERTVQKDPVLFFLYPAFFPQIVSGPIQRSDDFFSQIRTVLDRKADYEQIDSGFRLILGGLMLKLMVGDRLSAFIEIVDKSPEQYRYLVILTTVACYTLQLFADFAGYTNIAIGIGKLFGIDSPPNFAAPFAAANIQEMWRRWHMSLTSWVTDYLFTPLSMSLRQYGTAGMIICISLSMIIIGLWHGLTVNFLIFGLMHAFFVSVTALTLMSLKRRKIGIAKGGKAAGAKFSAWTAPGAVLTFVLMSLSQIFWHSPTWHQSILMGRLLFRLTPAGSLFWGDIRTDVIEPVFICMAVSYFVGLGSPGMAWVGRQANRFVPVWVQYGFCLFLLSALTNESGGKFVYGQF